MAREKRALTQADEALTSALERFLGIWDGSCGPGRLDVIFQGLGLKIWGGLHFVNHHEEKPLFQGRITLAMARLTYGIADPDDDQMSLF